MKLSFFVFLSVFLLFLYGCGETTEYEQANNESAQGNELSCQNVTENTSSPGTCSTFRDNNNDGFCDFE